MRRRGNNIALRRQRHRETTVVQGAAAGAMRDHDQPELTICWRTIAGYAHRVRANLKNAGLPTARIPDNDRKNLPCDGILNLSAAIADIRRRRGLDGKTEAEQHKYQAQSVFNHSVFIAACAG